MSYSWQFELECDGRDLKNRVAGLLAAMERGDRAEAQEWIELIKSTMVSVNTNVARAEGELEVQRARALVK